MREARVTIAIPTFDRPERLKRCVERLLAEWREGFEILVVDNHSGRPSAEAIGDVVARRPEVPVRIVRHPANIGATANLLRCFELADTEWLWPFGDDDVVEDGACARILAALEEFPETSFFNFASTFAHEGGAARDRPTVAKNLREVIEAIDNFSNLLFMSAGIYRREEFLPLLKFGFDFGDSSGAHVAMVMAGVNRGDVAAVFHPTKIVNWGAPEEDDGWDRYPVDWRQHKLLELVPNRNDRRKFFHKVNARAPLPESPFVAWVIAILFLTRGEMDDFVCHMVGCERVKMLAGHRGAFGAGIRLVAFGVLYLVLRAFQPLFRALVLRWPGLRGRLERSRLWNFELPTRRAMKDRRL